MPSLTPLETRVKSFIDTHWMDHYRSPTHRDLVQAGVCESMAEADESARALIDKGYLLPMGDPPALTPAWLSKLIDMEKQNWIHLEQLLDYVIGDEKQYRPRDS